APGACPARGGDTWRWRSRGRRAAGRSSQPRRRRKALLAQEGGVPELRLVARPVVGQDRDHGVPRAEIARHTDRPPPVDATRTAEAQSLLAQEVEEDREGLLVGDLVGLVHGGPLEIPGDAPLTDPLRDGAPLAPELSVLVVVVHRGAHGIGARDDDVASLLLERRPHAREGAARADGADEAVDAAPRLLPDLGPGG